jgi:hypothetical protein
MASMADPRSYVVPVRNATDATSFFLTSIINSKELIHDNAVELEHKELLDGLAVAVKRV